MRRAGENRESKRELEQWKLLYLFVIEEYKKKRSKGERKREYEKKKRVKRETDQRCWFVIG